MAGILVVRLVTVVVFSPSAFEPQSVRPALRWPLSTSPAFRATSTQRQAKLKAQSASP